MKQILAMSVFNCFSLVMNEHFANYAIISVQDSGDGFGMSFKRTNRCKAVLEMKFDDIDTDEEDRVLFTNKDAEKIIRFARRYKNVDTLVIHCYAGVSRSAAIKNALDECFGLGVSTPSAAMNRYIYSTIMNKWHELENAPVNTAEPMEYCKSIIRYTVNQIMEYIQGERDEQFNSLEFFGERQCRIYLNGGKVIDWDIEMNFSEIEIPDIDKIEYVRFFGCVPEIVSSDNFDDEIDFEFSAKFGIFSFEDNEEYTYDSVSGIIPKNDYSNIPKRFEPLEKCKYTRRHWSEFEANSKETCHYPELADAAAGAVAAESYLGSATNYSIREFWQYRPDYNEIYWKEFLEPVEDMCEKLSLNEVEKMTAYLAWIYIGNISECCHAENLTMTKLIFENIFKDSNKLHLFDKVWKLPDITKGDLVIDKNPINLLCTAIFAFIDTNRNISPSDKDVFMRCIAEADNLTHNNPELADAVIITGAIAGVYYQKVRIPPQMLQ